MVYRPTFCVKINCVSLTLIKCTQSTFPGVLTHRGVLSCEVHFLKQTSHYMNFIIIHPCNNFGLWSDKRWGNCVTLHSDFVEMSY